MRSSTFPCLSVAVTVNVCVPSVLGGFVGVAEQLVTSKPAQVKAGRIAPPAT